jgi:hypothetical protein
MDEAMLLTWLNMPGMGGGGGVAEDDTPFTRGGLAMGCEGICGADELRFTVGGGTREGCVGAPVEAGGGGRPMGGGGNCDGICVGVGVDVGGNIMPD